MAKNNDGTKLRWIHLILIVAGLFGSGVAAWVWQQAETKAIAKDVKTLDEYGSRPAKKHGAEIGIIKYRLGSIDKRQEAFSIKQEAMRKENEKYFKEILKQLPK